MGRKLVMGGLLLTLVHCGGGTDEPGAAGGSSAQCAPARSAPIMRPASCPSNAALESTSAAGAAFCAVDADCQADGAGNEHCLNYRCGPDECLSDNDCPDGQACACATHHGLVGVVNTCFPAGCRVGSDCGDTGACSVSVAGYCHSVTAIECHTRQDECNSDTDCCGSTPVCGYQPALGHWACQALPVCSG